MIARATVAAAFARSGVGVHSGEPAAARVLPAAWCQGVIFEHRGERVPARLDQVSEARGATTLGSVRTVEHLLAALLGAGVTDATVQVEGDELPILDGSAQPWSAALAAAGVVTGPTVVPLRVTEVVEVQQGASWARFEPCDRLEVAVEVDFDAPDLPRGTAEVVLEGDRFAREVAWARTFVLPRDVERLRASGRGGGATPDNTVLWGTSGLRAPDEAVRHKLLDAIGDLALLGPALGRMTVHRGSHALHHTLLREVLRRA